MKVKKAALHNLGCKVNAYETEAMQELLEADGYEIVPFQEGADVYIINTCTVTNIADRKSRQMIHRAKKMNPNAVIVAAGCYIQAMEHAGHTLEGVDIMIGNNKKQDLIAILQEYDNQQMEKVLQKRVIDINHTKEYEDLHLTRTAEHTRAYLKVQDGCNQFCSYCIIPFTRGRARSRRKEDVLYEVGELAKHGYREVVLTGIHLSSYGVDLEDSEDLLSLIQAVHEVGGIERIRLGSLEPGIVTERFAAAIGQLWKICPHFHLSLQSGCDETLRRMCRRYTAAEYEHACKLLRKYFEHPALTTDIIVGFPGETDEEFKVSKAFVEQMDFYETHVFRYSRREGTKAAAMEHQIAETVQAVRSKELLILNQEKQRQYEQSFLGKEVEVLLEEQMQIGQKDYMVGHTKEYLKIAIFGHENEQNQIKKVKIDNHSQIIH